MQQGAHDGFEGAWILAAFFIAIVVVLSVLFVATLVRKLTQTGEWQGCRVSGCN